jgi:hypothetical protein
LANVDLIALAETMRQSLASFKQSVLSNGAVADNTTGSTGSALLTSLSTQLTALTTAYNNLSPNYDLGQNTHN